jgi:hypothetical protein
MWSNENLYFYDIVFFDYYQGVNYFGTPPRAPPESLSHFFKRDDLPGPQNIHTIPSLGVL